ncbi:hypothetical protein ASC61_08940 [Aeromicrobium sp. Root344]|uniref:carboxypeptidase-like regulatory domain-containing protein n=1 Tax=Aeromicrobium sp. Root344 TaxID=1736521 RepID=UPI0006FA63B4|nr:carboxypeptidase-like regulatory domain-containing protein [Aeromicrobium sp. Root344]KQV75117.1 hypothetical protein ASC61_08940 [Aeromicrobium sp. Root344]
MTAPVGLTTTLAPSTVAITGTISDPEGYPLAGILVALFANGRDEGVRVETATTDDIGGYRFTRIHTTVGDDYRVETTDPSGAHVFSRSIVTITSGPTTTHHRTVQVAGHIQGTVTTRDAHRLQSGTEVCVTASGVGAVHAVNVSARGRFRIGGLPAGEYALTFHDSNPRSAAAPPVLVTVAAGRTTTIEDQVLPPR